METLRDTAMEACEVLVSCGFNRPIPLLTHRDVPQLIECVSLHSTILVIKAELDHVMQGLEDVGVLSTLQASPHLFRPLFIHDPQPLTAGEIWTDNENLCSAYNCYCP